MTGGATNIGRGITEGFLEQGDRVVVGQPDPGVAAPLVREYGDRVIPLQVDVGDADQCQGFVDEAAGVLGGIDVLVNNAAITGPAALSRLEEMAAQQMDEILRVNIGSVLHCCQAVLPHLRAARGGVIVNISSVNAFRPQRGAMVYAATKAAVSSLTQSLARELAVDRIRVVAVAPGDIRTESSMQKERAMTAQGNGYDIAHQAPLGQGRPEDVAGTVVFLCSERARFVTGVTWAVDGGWLA